jgi:cytochrome P450
MGVSYVFHMSKDINTLSANANAIPAATWFLIELLLDPILESRIQKEFSSALIIQPNPSHSPMFDINKLCSGPLCQAIYAETLRLRVGVMMSRKALEDVNFCGWSIKKGERIGLASSIEAMDETVWNMGSVSNPHPLDEFWADRFLVYPNDPKSGPLKPSEATVSPTGAEQKEDRGNPKFTLEGLATAWIPFSGAPRLCPGRHFAKQEMISAAAIMLASFEIELKTKPGCKPESDKAFFGFGTLPPKGAVPCRIRRRRKVDQTARDG